MSEHEFLNTDIPIIEIFNSVSGEGISSGEVFTFVRAGGCNLRCGWCDTKYSYAENGTGVALLKPANILDEISKIDCKKILYTGGEPLELEKAKRYLPLYLASKNYYIRIETNGACPVFSEKELIEFNVTREYIHYTIDIKCPGSGMEKYNQFENIDLLGPNDELKFVIAKESDLKYSMEVIEKYKKAISLNSVVINFSPAFSILHPEVLVNFLKNKNTYFQSNYLEVRLSLQIHKFIWNPNKRGV